MAYLTKLEAALRLGVGVELLDYFVRRCPKPTQQRKLTCITSGEDSLFNQNELDSFWSYLAEPWPIPANGDRPRMPDPIAEDIKRESHYECAICGNMNHGEVAHIKPVAGTLNNRPDNLIFLCPNHHTEYDLGYRPSSNVTEESLRAAKRVKGDSRRRMMRNEANVEKLCRHVVALLQSLMADIKKVDDPSVAQVYQTEVEALLKKFPDLSKSASEAAEKDQCTGPLCQQILGHTPQLARLAEISSTEDDESLGESEMDEVDGIIQGILNSIDEVDCPHCGGSGTVGLVGDFCRFCEGSCFVSHEAAAEYDPDEIDEMACPHCGGKGTKGWANELCLYCGGSCVVTREEAADYDPDDLDEVDCPHCKGSGQRGLRSDLCTVCRGSGTVSRQEADEYDPDEIDEVDCPRCGGTGTVGWRGDFCRYCDGSCFVSREEAEKYDPDDLDEVECPRCGGSGQKGWSSEVCSFCQGSCYIPRKESANYNPDYLDEEKCPHCGGGGTTGRKGDMCKLCKGACVVSREIAKAYRDKFGHN